MPSATRRFCGQVSGGPTSLLDQSNARMRLASSLSPGNSCSSETAVVPGRDVGSDLVAMAVRLWKAISLSGGRRAGSFPTCALVVPGTKRFGAEPGP